MTELMVIAQPYKSCNLGSFGKAKNMLIRQFNFPTDSWDETKDHIATGWLDRLRQNDRGKTDNVLKRYKLTENDFEDIRDMSDKKVLDCLRELISFDEHIWTGYRILGTVGPNGHAYFSLELFSKHPQSKTVVESKM